MLNDFRTVRPVQTGDAEGEAIPRKSQTYKSRKISREEKRKRQLEATRRLAAGEIDAMEAWRLYNRTE